MTTAATHRRVASITPCSSIVLRLTRERGTSRDGEPNGVVATGHDPFGIHGRAGPPYRTRAVSSWYVRGASNDPPTRNPPGTGVTCATRTMTVLANPLPGLASPTTSTAPTSTRFASISP